jgi:hypothetical protein
MIISLFIAAIEMVLDIAETVLVIFGFKRIYENPRNNRKKNIIVILYCDSSVILKTESLYNTLCIYNIEPTESRDNYTVG